MSAARGRVIVATAGHVDHGKTTLVRALTGVETDRLPEERRRGISIELGFAAWPGESVSFVDVPGHHRLVHTMIAGVGAVDLALLAVAADDGVMPQTREHLWILSLLGVRSLVVAFTKTDLAEPEYFELARDELAELVAELGFQKVEARAVCAPTGEGLDGLRQVLLDAARDVPRRRTAARTWLAVDRSFSIKGAGTVITGTLARGALRRGDEVYVVGPKHARRVSCRGLEVHGEVKELVRAPNRVAVNLARIAKDDVPRGSVIVHDELPVSDRIDVKLKTLPNVKRRVRDNQPIMVHVGTTRVRARIRWLCQEVAHLRLEEKVVVEGGVGVVVRGFESDPKHGALLGGGVVLDASAAAPPRRRGRRWLVRVRLAEALASGATAEAFLMHLAHDTPRPLSLDDWARRTGSSPEALKHELSVPAVAAGLAAFGDGSFTTRENFGQFVGKACDLVQAHHRAQPEATGLSEQTLREQLSVFVGADLAQAVVSDAVEHGRLERAPLGTVKIPAFRPLADVEQGKASLLAALCQAGAAGLTVAQLSEALGLSQAWTQRVLSDLNRENTVKRLGQSWYAQQTLDGLRGRVTEHLTASSTLSIANFKQISGANRKQTILLLEQLDREGWTRRTGEIRVAGPRLAAKLRSDRPGFSDPR